MKIVKQGSKPLLQNEFYQIKSLAEKNNFPSSSGSGVVFNRSAEAREAYIKKIISFVDIEKLKPLKIVINSGNGAAGQVVDVLKDKLETAGVKTDFVFVFHDPDSSFPNGIPNPLLEENQPATAEVVIREKADFGLAFDGDFDRCFLFDHLGQFIQSEYLVGLLAEVFLNKENKASIVQDTRVIWNTTMQLKKVVAMSLEPRLAMLL